MQSFEYKPNKSYSTYLISMGLLVSFLFIFNIVGFRENTFVFTIVVFISVFSWIIFKTFAKDKEKQLLTFEEDSLTLPAKATQSQTVETVMYRDIKSSTFFDGDIRNQKRPGHKGLEITFERVEGIEEVCFLQKTHFEFEEYEAIIQLLNEKIKELDN